MSRTHAERHHDARYSFIRVQARDAASPARPFAPSLPAAAARRSYRSVKANCFALRFHQLHQLRKSGFAQNDTVRVGARLKLPKPQRATQRPEPLYRTIAALEANPREPASSIAWLPFRRKIDQVVFETRVQLGW